MPLFSRTGSTTFENIPVESCDEQLHELGHGRPFEALLIKARFDDGLLPLRRKAFRDARSEFLLKHRQRLRTASTVPQGILGFGFECLRAVAEGNSDRK